MSRPIEKTASFTPDEIREMLDAYGSVEGVHHALGITKALARTMLHGERMHPGDYNMVMDQWDIVNPHNIRQVIERIYRETRNDREVEATVDMIEAADLCRFFNALFPRLKINKPD